MIWANFRTTFKLKRGGGREKREKQKEKREKRRKEIVREKWISRDIEIETNVLSPGADPRVSTICLP